MNLLTILISLGIGAIIGFFLCAILGAHRRQLMWELTYLCHRIADQKFMYPGNLEYMDKLIREIDPEAYV